MENKEYQEYLASDAWKRKAEQRLEIDNYQCQSCGCYGTTTNKIEVHHLSYKNIKNENVYTDLLSLCHCCHKNIHRAMERVTNENGRRGWLDDSRIPKIHVYTLDGTSTQYIEED